MDESAAKWEELLNPDIAREKLISASLYIAAFEILKDSICNRIRSFYSIGFDPTGSITDRKYTSEVLARNRSPLYASLDWLKEHEVLDSADIESFERIKAIRNNMAHNLQSLIFGESSFGHVEMFQELAALLRKIEAWWVINVKIPTNPNFDGQEIDEDGVVPGPVIMLQIMIEVATGNKEYLDRYREMCGREH
ncbi:hypothetical protein [Luteimonas sp. RC10]|uniref:hypothetical protein n=1 Tax=Luteimonas sp. RC10 TaxID=2587035 RepID=UPI0017EFA720|nr:hypothetical protein [Luteimonas sp. RC10]MBB3342220.1 hypothetical protein [Luteimonas sp. RC10]